MRGSALSKKLTLITLLLGQGECVSCDLVPAINGIALNDVSLVEHFRLSLVLILRALVGFLLELQLIRLRRTLLHELCLRDLVFDLPC